MKSPVVISQHASNLREQLEIGHCDVIGEIVEVIKKGGYDYTENCFGDDFSGYSEYVGKGRFVIGFNKDRMS
jgi:hypothetical protein